MKTTVNRRIVTAAVGLTAAGLLAGCGGGGDGPAASSSASSSASANHPTAGAAKAAPIVTPARARAILSHYQQVNNQANTSRNAKLLSTVEGGALFQQSAAQYRQFPAFDADVKALYPKPFSYVDPQFYLPTGGTWFMLSAGISGAAFDKGTRVLAVFQKDSAGGWKMVATSSYTGPLPALGKGDDGAPVAVEPSATVGGTRLAGLGAAVNDLHVSGGARAGAEFADSTVKKALVKEYTDRNADWGAYKNCLRTDFEDAGDKWDKSYTTHPDLFALRTADGGVLAVFTSYYVELDFSTHPETCAVVPSGPVTAYLKKNVPGIRSRYATLNAVHVPGSGKPVQLGGDEQLIGATA